VVGINLLENLDCAGCSNEVNAFARRIVLHLIGPTYTIQGLRQFPRIRIHNHEPFKIHHLDVTLAPTRSPITACNLFPEGSMDSPPGSQIHDDQAFAGFATNEQTLALTSTVMWSRKRAGSNQSRRPDMVSIGIL
jgi:hypothetical protein